MAKVGTFARNIEVGFFVEVQNSVGSATRYTVAISSTALLFWPEDVGKREFFGKVYVATNVAATRLAAYNFTEITTLVAGVLDWAKNSSNF
jgi:hypothetical protein